MSEKCYFCSEREVLEQHHIVPRRFDGGDTAENLIKVCPTCHRKLENLYDKRFYDAVGADRPDVDASEKKSETTTPGTGDIEDFFRAVAKAMRDGVLEEGVHYKFVNPNGRPGEVELRLHLTSAFEDIVRFAEKDGWGVAASWELDQIRNGIKELDEKRSFISERSMPTRLSDNRFRRCVGVDIHRFITGHRSPKPDWASSGPEEYFVTNGVQL